MKKVTSYRHDKPWLKPTRAVSIDLAWSLASKASERRLYSIAWGTAYIDTRKRLLDIKIGQRFHSFPTGVIRDDDLWASPHRRSAVLATGGRVSLLLLHYNISSLTQRFGVLEVEPFVIRAKRVS